FRIVHDVIGEKSAIARPARRDLSQAVFVEQFLSAGPTRFLAVEIAGTFAVGLEYDRAAIGRPYGIELGRGIEGESRTEAARDVVDPDVGVGRGRVGDADGRTLPVRR